VADPAPDWKPEPFKGETIDLGAPAARDWAEREVQRIVADYQSGHARTPTVTLLQKIATAQITHTLRSAPKRNLNALWQIPNWRTVQILPT